MINTNPEKRLSEILQFQSASKLVKDLRKEMSGLPTVEIVTDNLYNYVTRITTETSNQSYTSRARPIQRGKLASFFEIRREKKDKPRLGSRQQEKRGSITKQERQQLQPQKQRRQSCICAECGRENLKIKRLGLIGINTIKQIPHIIELKQRRTLLLDLINFSTKLNRRVLNSKRASKMHLTVKMTPLSAKSKKRSNSVSQEKIIEIKRPMVLEKKNQNVPTRQSIFLRRQNTITDKIIIKTEQSPTKLQTIPSNHSRSSKVETVIPERKTSPDIFQQKIAHKSLDKQLQLQLKYSKERLKRPLLEKKKSEPSPYKKTSLEFLFKIRRRF